MDKSSNYEKMKKLIKRKRSLNWYSNKLKIPVSEVKQLKTRIYKEQREGVDREVNENYEDGTLHSSVTTDFEPKDHQELARLHKIDLTKFVITNYWSKLKPNGQFTSSVFCKRKQRGDFNQEDFEKFLLKYKSNYIPITSLPDSPEKDNIDIEVSISDFHLAKKYVTEKNTNVKKRAEVFFSILEKLVTRTALMYNIDTVVFPISNDFFHSDTYFNTSTKGTPQDVIAEYDEEYEVGFDLLVNSISFLKSLGKQVVVILVQGNHDRTKSFYLAHALDIFFREDDNIIFMRDSDPIKAIKLGNTFIGYHHGNCKIDELPLVFATDKNCSKAFGESEFREVHTGDKHHYMAKEIKGVRIQQMPSLSGTDKWHRDQNYVNNIRAALVLHYDSKKGKIGELEERI